ncbi:PREDICTED: uricase [Ceratosolen solmsi marchali]|uniref:Uricase n=1 Tax=Ceratosolen solmsi marchali TaxID=326594 RepID=A0AAJ6YIR3_9HYME|nr:PREDICTED: uricase [Ceratosolen solmsi marchali]
MMHYLSNASMFGSLADGSLSIIGQGRSFGKLKQSPKGEIATMNRAKELQCPRRQTANATSCPGQDVRPNLIAEQDSDREDFELGAYGYGKNNVKLLYVHRENSLRHEIREYEIDVHLRLGTQKDYVKGDNRDIIATDSQKNTIYVMAKKHGVKCPEEFGILLCSHFLNQYKHVEEVNVNVEEYPWSRHEVDGAPHNHAFVFTPTVTRYCQVTQLRNGSPRIRGGLKNLRVLKTTKSSFTDFIQDDYRTLPDANDRIFSTTVTASWQFSTALGVNFDDVWLTVKDCILENFAGPPATGVNSPSVQNTLYLTEKSVLSKVNQICSIEMRMPNKHYFDIDMSRFSKLVTGENKEVYLPVDKPSGIIYAQLKRKDITSKL